MNKSKHLGIRLEPEEHEALAAEAAKMDRSISWLVRKIVTDWLKRKGGRRVI